MSGLAGGYQGRGPPHPLSLNLEGGSPHSAYTSERTTPAGTSAQPLNQFQHFLVLYRLHIGSWTAVL